jgi:formate dehydrogenase subunit gamma
MNRTIRAFAGAMLLCASVAFAQEGPGSGQGGPQSMSIHDAAKAQVERQQTQPGNNAPVWREVNSGKAFYTTAQGPEAGVLIQKGGEAWRKLRPSIYSMGGGLIGIALVLTMIFYAVRGPIKVQSGPSGRYIRRFTTSERIAHWTLGLSFVLLGLTGLVLTFGKYVLLPVIGYTLFGWLATFTKNLHNFVGPVFSMTLPIFIVMYIRNNLPASYDLKWLIQLGGLLAPKGEHAPSGKFSAAEKLYFWGMVCVVSVVLAVTGLILDFPNFDQTRGQMQLANTIHMIAAMIGIAMASFHIYLGTVGTKEAYEGMRYGYVDETWAKEHHNLWYEDVKAGKAPEPYADAPESVPEPVRVAVQGR